MKALIALLIVIPTAAQAQTAGCGPWKEIRKTFEQKYHEVPVSAGLAKDKILIVIASPDGATFTVFMLDHAGNACAMASGEGWEPGKNPGKPETNL